MYPQGTRCQRGSMPVHMAVTYSSSETRIVVEWMGSWLRSRACACVRVFVCVCGGGGVTAFSPEMTAIMTVESTTNLSSTLGKPRTGQGHRHRSLAPLGKTRVKDTVIGHLRGSRILLCEAIPNRPCARLPAHLPSHALRSRSIPVSKHCRGCLPSDMEHAAAFPMSQAVPHTHTHTHTHTRARMLIKR